MKKIALFFSILLFMGTLAVTAQTRVITGKVTAAEDGSPIPGVSISVQGTTLGTVSDIDGNFTLQVPQSAQNLIFSFVGMATQEVSIAGRTTVNVAMESQTIGVDEVVVTAFGISRARKALGYSATEVSSEDVLQKSEPDLLRSLDGKVAGVEIRSTGGAPGSATRMTIRGNTSFTGDNQPLFVVDGIPYSNEQFETTDFVTSGGAYGSGLATLDPNDIASTSVLKGAAAAALYGSRAKNGVVLITTKSGSTKAKDVTVTVNSSTSVEQISSLPEYQNTYGAGANFEYQNANGSWGPRFENLDSIKTWDGYSEAFGWGDSIPYVPQPNNVKDLFDNGLVLENSVNVQGGKENTSYNVTVSDLRNDGYIPHSLFNRSSISVGGNARMFNALTVTASTSYSTSRQEGAIYGANQATEGYGASSFGRALFPARNWILDPYTNPANGFPMQPNGDQFDNPYWSWENNKSITNMDRVVGNLAFDLKITDWMSATYRIGMNAFFQRRDEVIEIGSRATEYGKLGGITTDDVDMMEFDTQLFLNFNKDITDKIGFSGLVGYNTNERESDRQAYRGYKFVNRGIHDIDNTNDVIPLGGDFTKRRLIGALGEVTFDYDNFLFLTARGRNDWSSTLPKGNNSYFYPAVDGSFIFTDVLDIDETILSYGKLRASWGRVGMDAPPYVVNPVYYLRSGNFPFLGQPAMYTPNTAFDVNLNPEYKEDIEVGAELNFLNNRLNFDVALYKSVSTDMIYPVFVAPSSGYSQNYTNVGKMENKGIELAVDIHPVKTQNFNWNSKITYTKNINEVMNINDVDSIAYIDMLFGDPAAAIIVGQPYGVFYGNVSARDNEGNVLIDPSTGLMIDAFEQEVYGNPNPDYIMGISNMFSYKGLSLSFLIDYKKGGDIFSETVVTLLGRGVTKDTEDREKTVILPGVYGDANTKQPVLDANGNKMPNITQVTVNDLYFSSGFSSYAINAFGEWNVYDATTLRLREITLSYDIPKKILGNLPIRGAYLGVSGRNLWYWAMNMPEYTNFDPEISTNGATNVMGVEYSGPPSTRRFGFNLKVIF
ncbi:MAG: SusC/RagA family TonB-linked outer membrane protein [Prolixibacteraceae bacterium]|nr:SusC/RagA family TonB-linked outer membrane protein [Prolixibacteraceae bacterium]